MRAYRQTDRHTHHITILRCPTMGGVNMRTEIRRASNYQKLL